MKSKNYNEQLKEIKYIKLAHERSKLTSQGISTAFENGMLVTIGNSDCDYMDWQDFMLHQIIDLGSEVFRNKYYWSKYDLIEALREYDEADWQTIGEEDFDGIAA